MAVSGNYKGGGPFHCASEILVVIRISLDYFNPAFPGNCRGKFGKIL